MYGENGTRLNTFGYGTYVTNVADLSARTISMEFGDNVEMNGTVTKTGTNIYYTPDRLLDADQSAGYTASFRWASSSRTITLDDPFSWMSVILRMEDGAAAAVKYDLNYTYMATNDSGTVNASYAMTPTAFEISGSDDALNWETIVSTNDVVFKPANGNAWLSDGKFNTVKIAKPEQISHAKLPLPHSTVQTRYGVLNHVRSISAAAGSTLKFDGPEAPVVSGLTADPAGNGTIDGFDFAESGMLYVKNADPDSAAIDLAVDLQNASGIGHIAGWNLSINGAETAHYAISSASSSMIRVVKIGFRVIVR